LNLDLPIHALATELQRAWRDAATPAQVIIAPTGSGKTTQVPQLLHASGVIAPDKRIVVLQPRRVAARSVAARVAHEMNVPVGSTVGYQVRFDERIGPATQIAFVTEGILLRWLQSDPLLTDLGAVLFDEFHERNILSDVSLALCKQINQRRAAEGIAPLKLIVMSATLEAEPVARFLDAPVFESQGRSYPVDLRYQTWDDDRPAPERAAERVLTLLRERKSGDILVFMPGKGEIDATLDLLREGQRSTAAPFVMLALHGELPPREQDRVFAPSEYRRVIVATNVAETSVTIPNIEVVVDSGLARVARYDAGRGINTLRLEPISQASADQRAGRAGRVAPGVCYRLWSQKNHAARPPKNTPELQRAELSQALLQIHALGVRDIGGFDFLDKPDAARIAQAETMLGDLGAVTSDGALTDDGVRMLRIPAHPRYARMLLEAERHGCVREAALLIALASGRDILSRINPRDERDRIAKRNRANLIKRHQTGTDYFLLANSFAFAESVAFDGRQCFNNGVNAHVAREGAQIFEQMLSVCEEAGLAVTPFAGDDAALGKAIARCHLAGFVDHLAMRTSSGSAEYDLSGGRRVVLNDESLVRGPLLIVASEIREITPQNGSRFTILNTASAVELGWVRELAPAGLNERVEHVFDRLNKRVAAGRVLRFHDLILGGERVETLDPSVAARVLADEYAGQLERHPQGDRLKQRFAGRPPAELVDFLAQRWHGASSWAEAREIDVLAAPAAAD
jgi:ATP-dependent helicase HrpB